MSAAVFIVLFQDESQNLFNHTQSLHVLALMHITHMKKLIREREKLVFIFKYG